MEPRYRVYTLGDHWTNDRYRAWGKKSRVVVDEESGDTVAACHVDHAEQIAAALNN